MNRPGPLFTFEAAGPARLAGCRPVLGSMPQERPSCWRVDSAAQCRKFPERRIAFGCGSSWMHDNRGWSQLNGPIIKFHVWALQWSSDVCIITSDVSFRITLQFKRNVLVIPGVWCSVTFNFKSAWGWKTVLWCLTAEHWWIMSICRPHRYSANRRDTAAPNFLLGLDKTWWWCWTAGA